MSPSPTDKKQRGKAVSPHWKKGVQQGSAGDRKRKAESEERGHGGSRCRDPRAVSDVVGGRTFPVSSPVTLLLGMRIPVSFLVCHQPKLTVKPRAYARSSSPVVDKPPPFCPSAFRGMYPLFSPSDFFITRRHRLLLLCLLGMVSQLVPKSARLRLLRAFTSRSWIHSELVMFLWSGVNTCVATTTRRQEV